MSMKYGLIGKDLTHSLSPKIHKIILDEIGEEGEYLILDVDEGEIKYTLKNCIFDDFKGVNVTIPYKIKIMKYLHLVDPNTKNIGACNTILFKDGYSLGLNTDYFGFSDSIKKYSIPHNNVKVLIIGTGGVSKVVSEFFKSYDGNEIFFVSRDGKGEKIYSYDSLNSLEDMDIVINCTPCGMYPNVEDTPISTEIIKKFKYAIDLIYNPKETCFLKIAKELGLAHINGFHMLISQAIRAEEIWNNIKIDEGIFNRIVDRCYNEIYKYF